jgi:cytochrome c biogenesis protein CcmG, thiol:disulfide interchange protein DsbE
VGSKTRRSDTTFRVIALVATAGLIAFVVTVIVSSSPTAQKKVFPDPPPPALATGKAAPGFALARLGGGAEVQLSGLRGKPVIVNFFASWCPDCQAELSTIATVAREEIGRLYVVGVDTNDSNTTGAKRLLALAGARYPVGVDPEALVATRYLIQALPVTYFLDARGLVVGETFGQLTRPELDAWVTRLGGGSGG